jgi:adenosylcobinamide kinase/adenosylcobinamide-phosphate guanylyltransferase
VGETLPNHNNQADVVLLDCLTLLVSNLVMEASPDVDQPNESVAKALVEAEIAGLKDAIPACRADWIVVSNEVGLGLVPPYPLGRLYRDLLGWANQALAAVADEVYFMVAGIPTQLT